jgi:orotate phosphoribosyltransferase
MAGVEELHIDTEELVVGLYDVGEIGFVQPPAPDVEVKDPDYPEEAFKKLKSGRMSPHYVNGRNVTSFSKNSPLSLEQQLRVRNLVVSAFCHQVFEHDGEYEHLLGIPEAMTCLTGLVAQHMFDSVLWMRAFGSENKKYGIHELIQGRYDKGDKVFALDNVITDSASKLQVAAPLEANGLQVARFGVLVDREEGGREALEAAGYSLSAVVGMQAITRILAENGRITSEQQQWAEIYRERTLASLQ